MKRIKAASTLCKRRIRDSKCGPKADRTVLRFLSAREMGGRRFPVSHISDNKRAAMHIIKPAAKGLPYRNDAAALFMSGRCPGEGMKNAVFHPLQASGRWAHRKDPDFLKNIFR